MKRHDSSLKLSSVRFLLLCFTLVAFSVPTLAEEAVGWQSVIREAAQKNGQLLSAEQSLKAARASIGVARSNFLPKLDGSLTYKYGETSASGDLDETYTAGLTVSQNLFAGFQDQARVNQASANVENSKAAYSAASAKVSVDLKTAYADLLLAQRSVTLQGSIVKRRQENYRLVNLRFQSGRENLGSKLLSNAYLEQAKLDEMRATDSITVARADLGRVLGRDQGVDFVVTDDVVLSAIPSLVQFENLVLENPAYRQAVAQVDSADASVDIARSGFFPSLALNGQIGRADTDWFPRNEIWSVGASISFPLFSGGSDFYSTRSAVATRSSAELTKQNLSRETISLLKKTLNAYQQALQKVKVDQSFLEAANKRAEIARKKYDNGLMTFDDWDVIENDLITREKAVIQSRRDAVVAEANWQAAQGKGVFE